MSVHPKDLAAENVDYELTRAIDGACRQRNSAHRGGNRAGFNAHPFQDLLGAARTDRRVVLGNFVRYELVNFAASVGMAHRRIGDSLSRQKLV